MRATTSGAEQIRFSSSLSNAYGYQLSYYYVYALVRFDREPGEEDDGEQVERTFSNAPQLYNPHADVS